MSEDREKLLLMGIYHCVSAIHNANDWIEHGGSVEVAMHQLMKTRKLVMEQLGIEE